MRNIIIWLIGAYSLMTACGGSTISQNGMFQNNRQEDLSVLRVAVMPTLDCLPLFVASERGFFSNKGVEVLLVPYRAQMDQDTAILRGWVEGIVTDLVRAERLQRHDSLSLHYLTATSASWQLVSNKMARIKTPSQMKDKMMAMARFSATDFFADMLMDEAALDSDEVFKIQVNDLKIRLGMLKTGIMDAMFLPEPQATEARLLGSPIVMDTHDGDLHFGVLAFKEVLYSLDFRKDQIEAFTEAYNDACDSINRYGLKFYGEIIKRYCETTDDVLKALPKNIHYNHAESPRDIDIQRARNWLDKQR